jgi:hypothetical protein
MIEDSPASRSAAFPHDRRPGVGAGHYAEPAAPVPARVLAGAAEGKSGVCQDGLI